MNISSFSQFLVEEEKTLYFVWGRMNPPTAGHEKLLDFLKKKSGKNPFRIYLTQSEDKVKNPLKFADKVKFARKGFPQYARQIMMNKKLKTIFDAMVSFHDEGFKKVVIVAGSDRINEYSITLNKYNGKKGRHGFYNFENIEVLNAGNRDPESKGLEGVSGTKLRGYVGDGDFAKFSQNMPKKLSDKDTKAIFNSVRKGMGLKEQSQFKHHVQLESVSAVREAFVNDDLFSVGDTVAIKENGLVATIKHLGANYLIVETDGIVYRKWLDAVEKVEIGETPQDPDIKDKEGTQPKAYFKGLKKGTKDKRDAHFKKNADKADDDPSAYKPAPGDKKAKTKPSKHTKKFKQMFGDE